MDSKPISWARLAELAQAESEGRILILPHPPEATLKLCGDKDFDVFITGHIQYETVSNEGTEWISEEVMMALTDCAEEYAQELAREEKERLERYK